MSLEKTRGQSFDLSKILNSIDHGLVALPDFQRDFDWTTTDVRALLATVLSGWPIGSLLLMSDPPDRFFNLRPIEQAPELQDHVETIVLDGQQRLTALYHALYGRGDVRYGLRADIVDENLSIDSLDEAIMSVAHDEWDRKYSDPKKQLSASVIPMTALRDATEFFKWRDAALAAHPDYAGPDLTEMYRTLLSGLHRYDIPAVVIDPDVPPAGIARIFERVNRMGMPLGTFDLVVAKSFSSSFNLRKEWERARQEFPKLDAFFEEDGLGVLSVIALRTTENVRQQAILEMPGSAVRDGWLSAAEATSSAIEFLSRELGVWRPDWLPYRNMLTILSALSYDVNLSDVRDEVSRWFWKTAFERRYDVASNTRAVTDYKILSSGADGPWTESALTVIMEDLQECNKKQFGTLHRAFSCLLAGSDALDILTGEELDWRTLESGARPEIGLAPLYARDQTTADGRPAHLLTLAMVLAGRTSSRKIASTSFEDMEEIGLLSQLVPSNISDTTPVDRLVRDRYRLVLQRLGQIFGRDVRVLRRED